MVEGLRDEDPLSPGITWQQLLELGVRGSRSGMKPDLPLHLRTQTWVDLRDGLGDDGLTKLIRGISGQKPGPNRSPVAWSVL